MADYWYSVAIQANLFHNNMADKTVWRINWGQINEYSLYSHESRYSNFNSNSNLILSIYYIIVFSYLSVLNKFDSCM